MIRKSILLIAAVFAVASMTSCITTKKQGPPSRKMSNMPHNTPAAWEGQGGLGGMPTSQ